MTRHECPDCGHVHEMKAEERIRRLEEKVRDLEAARSACPHPHYYWWQRDMNTAPYPWVVTSGTTWQPDRSTTITYDSATAPQFTLT